MHAALTERDSTARLADRSADDPLQLEAGPRLDSLIESLVFGRCRYDEGGGRWSTSVGGGRRVPPRPFSTEIDAARLLLGHLDGGFLPVAGGAVDVVINGRRFREAGSTYPLAICRAILRWHRANAT